MVARLPPPRRRSRACSCISELLGAVTDDATRACSSPYVCPRVPAANGRRVLISRPVLPCWNKLFSRARPALPAARSEVCSSATTRHRTQPHPHAARQPLSRTPPTTPTTTTTLPACLWLRLRQQLRRQHARSGTWGPLPFLPASQPASKPASNRSPSCVSSSKFVLFSTRYDTARLTHSLTHDGRHRAAPADATTRVA